MNYDLEQLMNQYGNMLIGIGIGFGILMLIVLISFAKIFSKAGEPGWAAFIPVYHTVVLVKIIGKPAWWVIPISIFSWIANFWDSSFSSLLSLASAVFAIWATNLLVHKFGKTTGFTIGMIFLPFIFAPILAFGDAEYQGGDGTLVDEFGSKTPDVNLES